MTRSTVKTLSELIEALSPKKQIPNQKKYNMVESPVYKKRSVSDGFPKTTSASIFHKHEKSKLKPLKRFSDTLNEEDA
jgi:hypothetical protein